MNLNQNFEPARVVARHCAELTRAGPRPEEREACLAIWRREVAEKMLGGLCELLAGSKLTVQLSDLQKLKGDAAFERIGSVAANCLIRIGPDEQTALLSFGLETAIELTDRSFGGTGEMTLDPVNVLPRSATLLVEEAARIIAMAIAATGPSGAGTSEPSAEVLLYSQNAARLKPWNPEDECAWFDIEIAAQDAISWTGKLIMSLKQLDCLLDDARSPVRSVSDSVRGDEAAMSQIPLPLQAVLAEFDLSLERLAQLKPGDCIALSVGRELPLRIADTVFARGTLGTVEDRIALRLTTLSPSGSIQ